MVDIRPAERSDVAGLIELFHAVAAEGRWLGTEVPFDEVRRTEMLAGAIVSDESLVLLATVAPGQHDELVGQLGLHDLSRGVAELGILVAAPWRGKGVGSALLAAGIERARERGGIHKIALEVWPHNEAARALYRRFGFVEEGHLRRHHRRHNGELWDSIVMGLVLDEESPGSSESGE